MFSGRKISVFVLDQNRVWLPPGGGLAQVHDQPMHGQATGLTKTTYQNSQIVFYSGDIRYEIYVQENTPPLAPMQPMAPNDVSRWI